MRKTAIAFGIAAAIIGYIIPRVHASTGPIPLNCNRACLEGVMDQYLAALVAHDPKRLPLSADAMYTENDQIMDIGDGFWKTVQGVGNYKHIFADPEFGQVAFMGTMREAGAVLLMSLRLRIELGRITEIESVYYRQGGGGPSGIPTLDAPGYKPEDMWFKSIPAAQRPTRQEMIAVADGYFSGLQKNDGKGINGTGTYPFTQRLPSHRKRRADHERAPSSQRAARHHQRLRHGLPLAVQARLLFRGAEHSPPPLSLSR